jgi:hypothetical protein
MFDLDDEWSDSLQDQRHRFVANGVLRLPYAFLVSGLIFAASSSALAITTGGVDINGDGSNNGDRPTCGRDPRFVPGCAYLAIPDGTRVPRNALRSTAALRVDLRFSRRFSFGSVHVDPALEVFNVFNRQNNDPGTFNAALSNPAFGSPGRSAELPYLPRQFQLSVRMVF